MRYFFRFSRFFHKYIGLFLLLYFLAMGVSGLLLAHPQLIRTLHVPWSFLPDNYVPENWNRMYARTGVVIDDTSGRVLLLAGKAGVEYSRDGGHTFDPLSHGLPSSYYERDVTALHVEHEASGSPVLYAATRGGLFRMEWHERVWQQVTLPNHGTDPVVDLIRTPQHLIAVTPYALFRSEVGADNFTPAAFDILTPEPRQVAWFRILHDIHNGAIFGFVGKRVVDILGISLIFFCITGALLWYVPWHNRQFANKRIQPSGGFVFSWRYHLKIGIWVGAFMAISALSGALLRPPLLIAVAPYSVSQENPWLAFSERGSGFGGKMQRGIYSSANNSIIVATEGGFFEAPAHLNAPFIPLHIPVMVHGMGTTVLREVEDGGILIGSFSGLFLWHPQQDAVWRLPRPGLQGTNPFMSNDLVSGIVMLGAYPYWRIDYHDGLLPLLPDRPAHAATMPARVIEQSPMSLWHYLFEFHNGRIFEKWLGNGYMLIVPLGGLLLMILCLTGIFDWCYRKVKRKSHTVT